MVGRMLAVQRQIVEALMKPEAYEEEAEQIELKQTHISWVFLTGKFVYKVKKAVDFGFLDFSTLEKRRFFCEKELELNRRLCGDMYLEVVPINKSDVIKIGGEGETVEYAVKMKRMPEEKIMTRLLEEGKVDRKLIDRMAKIIAEFHLKAETSKRIGEFGSLPMIETNWTENFDQSGEFIGETIPMESYRLICERIGEFMKGNAAFFAKRVAENRIRECHGDIHSGNIFVADRIYIFDGIEFNERFRFSDVASDIEKLLDFYKCYRAYVRGKVISFKLKDPNENEEEKSAAKKEAKVYFELAADYARRL